MQPNDSSAPSEYPPALEQAQYLEVFEAGGKVWRIPLTGNHFIVGRSPKSAVCIDHAFISRHHAEIFTDPFGRWWVRDLGSRNGIKVNKVAVKERILQPRDKIQIGPFSLVLRVPFRLPDAVVSDEATRFRVILTQPTEVTPISEIHRTSVPVSSVSTLLKFGYQLVGVEDPSERLSQLCSLLVQIDFQCKAAVVVRMSRERPGDPPIPISRCRFAADWSRNYLELAQRLLQRSVVKSMALMARGLCPDRGPEENESPISLSTMATVVFPLRSDLEYMDLLYLVVPPNIDLEGWVSLLSLVKHQFTVSEFSWMAERQVEAQAIVNAEVQRGREIQQRLAVRPLAVPGVELAVRQRPTRWVGGDYADTRLLPDGRLLAIVADPTGCGLPAARAASHLNSISHACLRAELPFPTLLRILNDQMHEHLASGSFVKLLALLLDPASGALEYAVAGSPPPLLVDPSGGLRMLDGVVNPPLGLEPRALEIGRAILPPGHLLWAYTNGVTQMLNTAGEPLGRPRLHHHVQGMVQSGKHTTVEALVERLDAWLTQLQGNRIPDTDHTVLALRRKPG